MTTPLLEIEALRVSIGKVRVVDDLDLRLAAGERLVILGRNGAGKTTLLHTLAGLRAPDAGSVTLCGLRADAAGLRQAAQCRALLPQQQEDAFRSTVLETALIGRHPHLGRWSWESADDIAIAHQALAAVGLQELSERDVHELSGGERQRVAIASVLAQQPRVYLLDEPLAHLDLNHQIAVLDLFAERARAGAAVVMVMHDINLAQRYGDRALLLFGDGKFRAGPVREVIDTESLSELYGHPLRAIEDRAGRYFVPQ